MSPRSARGSMSIELVLLTPVLVGGILTIAGASRIIEAADQVGAASAVAARAASLQTDSQHAALAGRTAAERALKDRGRACVQLDVQIDATPFEPGESVRATVTCRADLRDVVGFGLPGEKVFSESSVVPLDQHRAIP